MTPKHAERGATGGRGSGAIPGGCIYATWAASLLLYLPGFFHPLAALLALLVPSILVFVLTVVGARAVVDPVSRGLFLGSAALQVLVLVPLVALVPLTARVDRGGVTTIGFLVGICVTLVAVLLLNALLASGHVYQDRGMLVKLVSLLAAVLAPAVWLVVATVSFLGLSRGERYGIPVSAWFDWSLVTAIMSVSVCFVAALVVIARGRLESRTAGAVAIIQVLSASVAGAFSWFLIAYHMGT